MAQTETAAKQSRDSTIQAPDKLSSYFKKEIAPLSIVTVSGLVCNIGLTAAPYFEGQLAQKLYDIMGGRATFHQMLTLAGLYILVILLVQGARCLKRFYVRRFANDTGKNMRHVLYNHLVHQSRQSLKRQSEGELMTKAVADVDACAEGMRKFTTEVFDTGVALMAYLVMMFFYDWKLTLLSCAFTPVAYIMAEKMKTIVYRYTTAYKQSAGALNDATLERARGAITYRVFSEEKNRDAAYEKNLSHYEHSAVMANIWENTMQPLYNIIAMTGVLFILYFGGKNVMGTGSASWDIAAFTAFLSCFAKTAIKAAKAAKLFNAVQKAQVSWKRIKPMMKAEESVDKTTSLDFTLPVSVRAQQLGAGYTADKPVFSGLDFAANPGDIIGITGPVACGKSTLGKVFLGEVPYAGSLTLNGKELRSLTDYERNCLISYLGHQPELMGDTIENNITYGDAQPAEKYIRAVRLDGELAKMPHGADTVIGSSGAGLSGGQQDRVALARTLYHARKILVLDDPFSAVDAVTERQMIDNIKTLLPDAVILILSHRVTHFSEFAQVIWMQNGHCTVGTHAQVAAAEPAYAKIYAAQQAGGDLDNE